MDEQQIIEIAARELLGKAGEMKDRGYRLAAVSCTDKAGFELSYSFDRDLDFVTYRIRGGADTELESISGLYSYAFLYENEIVELFGVKISNIPVDFEGKLYRIRRQAPFHIKTVESPQAVNPEVKS